jgi:PAS domain S-box-containing protein
MVERTRFLDLFRLPLSLNVVHWLGNMALGILGATLWTARPIALVLMVAPVALTYSTYRRWVQSIRERDQMRDLYEAGRALSAPLASREDFGGFLGLLEKLLAADRVELVVVDGNRVGVHASAGVRYLTVEESDAAPLEAFVAVRSGVAPQIAMVGDGEDVRGVLAVYRTQGLTAPERLLLDGLANQIADRLKDHRLFGKTLERARLSQIVSHTSDGIFTVDRLGRITTWNPAMAVITGYAEAEAVGRDCEDLLGIDRDMVFSDGDADGEPRDTAVRTRDRFLKDIRLRTSVIRDDEDAPPARIVVVRDASEESRAEEIKRDFVSMVSHELRTPLTPLKGFLASFVEGTVEDSPDKRQEYYRIMLRQAQRLERTVNDMLDASQIEAGGLVVDLQPVPLDHVLTRLVQDFREQHPDRPVVLGSIERPAIALADPFRVEQVALNLLSNAHKYTPIGLPIDVTVARDDHEITISVRDRGPGIAPEHRQRVFDRFFRVKDGSGPRTPGTGLGLYIARTLVEAMSGRIWLESRGRSGTTFSFTLPVVDIARLDGAAAAHRVGPWFERGYALSPSGRASSR